MSDKEVILALIGLANVIVVGIFGVINVLMQQRNKNVTVKKADEVSAAIAVNTEITKNTNVKAEETHRFIQENK